MEYYKEVICEAFSQTPRGWKKHVPGERMSEDQWVEGVERLIDCLKDDFDRDDLGFSAGDLGEYRDRPMGELAMFLDKNLRNGTDSDAGV